RRSDPDGGRDRAGLRPAHGRRPPRPERRALPRRVVHVRGPQLQPRAEGRRERLARGHGPGEAPPVAGPFPLRRLPGRLTAGGAPEKRRSPGRWLAVLLVGALTFAAPVPAGVTTRSWALLAVFLATVAGLVAHPIPGGAVVFLAVSVIALTGILPVKEALAGYADPVVWLGVPGLFFVRRPPQNGTARPVPVRFLRPARA